MLGVSTCFEVCAVKSLAVFTVLVVVGWEVVTLQVHTMGVIPSIEPKVSAVIGESTRVWACAGDPIKAVVCTFFGEEIVVGGEKGKLTDAYFVAGVVE